MLLAAHPGNLPRGTRRFPKLSNCCRSRQSFVKAWRPRSANFGRNRAESRVPERQLSGNASSELAEFPRGQDAWRAFVPQCSGNAILPAASGLYKADGITTTAQFRHYAKHTTSNTQVACNVAHSTQRRAETLRPFSRVEARPPWTAVAETHANERDRLAPLVIPRGCELCYALARLAMTCRGPWPRAPSPLGRRGGKSHKLQPRPERTTPPVLLSSL